MKNIITTNKKKREKKGDWHYFLNQGNFFLFFEANSIPMQYRGMKTLFFRPTLARELKRLARENRGESLKILDDVVFKAMLSADNEDSREALRSLLSACTHREVSTVQVINNDLVPAHLDAKTARLDVHITFNDGESADLEMQAGKSDDDLKTRAEYYSSLLLASQQTRGKPYRRIKRVYQIFFLNCVLFPGSAKLSRRYFYQEEEEHDRLSEATEIIFYELPKLEKRLKEFLEGKEGVEILTNEEKWCMYMRYRHEERAGSFIERLCREEEGIMRAEQAVTKVSRDYIKYSKKMAEIKNSMDRAQELLLAREEAEREGHEHGMEMGMREGMKEGIKTGMEKGHMEKTLEIARKMKAFGDSFDRIHTITGLPLEDIEKL